METIKVQIDEKKAKDVRAMAMQIYGHKKGAISAAINTAIEQWLAKFSKSARQKRYKPNWGSLKGALKEVKTGSVELQHATTRARMEGR